MHIELNIYSLSTEQIEQIAARFLGVQQNLMRCAEKSDLLHSRIQIQHP